ncbi:MAG: efflux RND transporter periplasmic adaptor subunit [Candidatus Rifleibacteriota bacterium]
MKKLILFIIILLLIVGSLVGWYFSGSSRKAGSYITDKITKGDIKITISSTGSLAALKTVEVGSQISGNILQLYADFNDEVKKGQLLAQLDPATYEARVQQAKANLENARASLKSSEAQLKNLEASLLNSHSEVQVSKANIRKAEVAVEEAERNFGRIKELFAKKLVSAAERDQLLTTLESQKAALVAARAQLNSARARTQAIKAQMEAEDAQILGAEARIKQMEAQLNIAQIDLDRTRVYSPIDGVVISRDVDVGQTVAASLQAPRLFIIAQDLKKMQIDTAVDEADIGKVAKGQKVTFTVDAYRNRTFEGVVEQVRLSPVVTSNVVTYSVMVNVFNNDLLLKPGMTASVEILSANREDVVRLPTQALYFKAPENMQHKMDDLVSELATDTLPVWILNKRPELKKVKIGISNNDYIEVLDGSLQPGDRVITGLNGNSAGASGRRRSMKIRM